MRHHRREDVAPQASPVAVAPRRSVPASPVLRLQRLAGNRAVARIAHDEVADPAPGQQVAIPRSGGAALPTDVRALMESRFGADFSTVRIHTDAAGASSARALQARAYTTGEHVVFGAGAYRPGARDGLHTIAHELAHVLQQRAGAVDGTPIGGGVQVSDPDDRFERAAEATARAVLRSLGPTAAADAAAPDAVAAHRSAAGGIDALQRENGKDDDPVKARPAGEHGRRREKSAKTGTDDVGAEARAYAEVFAGATKRELEDVGVLYEQYAGAIAKASAEAHAKGEWAPADWARVKGEAKASVEAAMGAYAGVVEGSARLSKVVEALFVLAEAGVVVGANFNAEAAARLGISDKLSARVAAKVDAFVGARAHAAGRLGVTRRDGRLVGAQVEGEAEAFAGARGQATATGEVAIPIIELGVEGEVAILGEAGALANAHGKAIIDPTRGAFVVAGSFEAFAGARVTAKVAGRAKLLGDTMFDIEFNPEASAGAGAAGAVDFRFRGGKVVLGAKALATLGVGGGGRGRTQIDFKPLARGILVACAKGYWAQASTSKRQMKADPAVFSPALRRKLEIYRNFKIAALQSGNAEHYVKRSHVMPIIEDLIPVSKVRSDAIDAAVKRVLDETLSIPEFGVTVTATVRKGTLEELDVKPSDHLDRIRGRGKTMTGGASSVGAGTSGESPFGDAFFDAKT